MTEDQVHQLASLGANVEHVLKALADMRIEMRDTIAKLATKEELAAMVSKREHDLLSFRVETLEKEAVAIRDRLKEQSASSIMDKLQKVAVTVTTVAAACGVVVAIILHFSKG